MRLIFRYLLFFIGLGLLCWTVWLTLHDIILFDKDLPRILFDPRDGELMDLGLGFRGIHYLVIGIVLVIVPFVWREEDSTKSISMWDEMEEAYGDKNDG